MKKTQARRRMVSVQVMALAAGLMAGPSMAMGPWWGPGYPGGWMPPPYYGAYGGYYGGYYGMPAYGYGGLPSPSFNYTTTIIQAPAVAPRSAYPSGEPRTLTCQRRASPTPYECTYP